MLNQTQLPLSVLAADCVMYPQVLKNVEVDDKDATLDDEKVKAAVLECTEPGMSPKHLGVYTCD